VENHERMRIGGYIPPQRIRTSDVAVKRRTGTRGVGNEKGNVVGLQAIGCGGYKRSKRVATDEIAQTFWFVFFKSFWQVHGLNSVCICSQLTLDSSNAMHSDQALGDRAREHLVGCIRPLEKGSLHTASSQRSLLWDRAR
jgi:hypothetical protein